MKALHTMFCLFIILISNSIGLAQTVNEITWKQTIIHTIDTRDTFDGSYLRDSALILFMDNAVITGKVKAYSAYEGFLTQALIDNSLETAISSRIDTVEVVDPVTGTTSWKQMVVRNWHGRIHWYSVVENWSYSAATGKTETKIVCIGPVFAYEDEPNAPYYKRPFYWIKYEDAIKIIQHYERQHGSRPITEGIWNDYFTSNEKPQEIK